MELLHVGELGVSARGLETVTLHGNNRKFDRNLTPVCF